MDTEYRVSRFILIPTRSDVAGQSTGRESQLRGV